MKYFSKFEIIIVLLSVSLIPLMSLLIGVTFISLITTAPSLIIQMYSERVAFVLTVVAISYFLKTINFINTTSQ